MAAFPDFLNCTTYVYTGIDSNTYILILSIKTKGEGGSGVKFVCTPSADEKQMVN